MIPGRHGSDDSDSEAATPLDDYSLGLISALELRPDARLLDISAASVGLAAALAAKYPAARVSTADHRTLSAGCRVGTVSPNSPGRQRGRRFDLIHSRLTLGKAAARNSIVATATTMLRPGGVLMLTEPYQLDDAAAPDPVLGKVLAAYHDHAVRTGAALTWIRTVPSLLTGLEFTDIQVHALPIRLGGGAQDQWWGGIESAHDRLDVSPADIRDVHHMSNSPGWVDIPQILLTIIARNRQATGPCFGQSAFPR
ncbi:hypothetical protein [Nocardia wallacei]|uniref:hypothetical protein n=1 Tax=Nocardia wallacei TaxID=480035 RepID=UPI00245499B7|nr:hypothetical protein [Nocardia wallacei]